MTFSDDFNRANNASTLGTSWTALKGTWGINNNEAYISASHPSFDQFAVVDANTVDGFVQATAGTGVTNFIGLVFRVSDTSNFWEMVGQVGGAWQLYKMVAGVYSSVLTSGGNPVSSGDVVRVEMSGSAITGKVNGVTVLTYNDTFNQTATKHGMYFYGTPSIGRWDNFSMTRLATFTPPVASHGVPPTLLDGDPEQDRIAYRLFRYYSARPGGDSNNVYYRITSAPGDPEVGEVTNVDPYTTYNSDGTILTVAWSDVAHVWWAGHAPEPVTAAQEAALIAGGYTVT